MGGGGNHGEKGLCPEIAREKGKTRGLVAPAKAEEGLAA